jgi:hypothetical protein
LLFIWIGRKWLLLDDKKFSNHITLSWPKKLQKKIKIIKFNSLQKFDMKDKLSNSNWSCLTQNLGFWCVAWIYLCNVLHFRLSVYIKHFTLFAAGTLILLRIYHFSFLRSHVQHYFPCHLLMILWQTSLENIANNKSERFFAVLSSFCFIIYIL